MVGDDSLRTWRDGPTVDRRLDFSDCGTLLEVHEQIRKEPGAAAVVRAEPGCAVGQPDRDHGDPGGCDDRVQAADQSRGEAAAGYSGDCRGISGGAGSGRGVDPACGDVSRRGRRFL